MFNLIKIGDKIINPAAFIGFRIFEKKNGKKIYWLDIIDAPGYAELTEEEFKKFIKINKIKIINLI